MTFGLRDTRKSATLGAGDRVLMHPAADLPPSAMQGERLAESDWHVGHFGGLLQPTSHFELPRSRFV
jgi:hypothetical protein